jgi:hypothetical protein
VEQLLLEVRDKPCLADLWETFNALPPDLEKLYDTIMKKVGPDRQRMAAKLYQLLMEWKRSWSGQIGTTLLWFAANCADPTRKAPYSHGKSLHWLTRDCTATKTEGASKNEEEINIIPVLKRLLEGHTRGILQISRPDDVGTPTVDFLHRTAFDWIRTDSNWANICDQGPPDFDAVLPLIAVLADSLQSMAEGSIKLQSFLRLLRLAEGARDTRESRKALLSMFKRLEPGRFFGTSRDISLPRNICPRNG